MAKLPSVPVDNSSSSTSSADRVQLTPVTATENGTLDSVVARIWLSAAGTCNWRGLVYSDNAGNPGDLLAVTADGVLTATAEAEQFLSCSGVNQISIVAGTTYWIGWHHSDPGTPSVTWSRAGTAGFARQITDTFADGSPATGAAATTATGPMDVYLNYTPASGETQKGKMLQMFI